MEERKIGVIGGGAWGTGMAQAIARGNNSVEIWAMEEDVVQSINSEHENKRFLPGYKLSGRITCSDDIVRVASDKEILFIASPSIFLTRTMEKIKDVPSIANGSTIIAAVTKGFVPSDSGPKLILETMESVLPEFYKDCTVYVAGPSHAEEVAIGKLTGLVAASLNPKNSIKVRELLRVPGLMVFSSFDVVGVQICAAAKNVVAVVYGAMDALSETSDYIGDNTESLLLAAGLNEIQTLGFAMGASHAETFTSISGVGDLDVTCKSKYGRNRRFGQDIVRTDMLSKFKDIDDLIANVGKIGYLPEGAIACKYVHEIAQKKDIKLPICDALFKILNKEQTISEIMQTLIK